MRRKRKTTQPRKTAKKRNLGRYKSAIEKYCADKLSDAGISFAYEEREYLLFDKFKYNGVYHKMTQKKKDLTDRSNSTVLPIKYTPDFCGVDKNFVVEVKGYIMSHHDFPMRWKLFLKYLSDHEEENLPALFIVKNKSQVDEMVEIIKTLPEWKK